MSADLDNLSPEQKRALLAKLLAAKQQAAANPKHLPLSHAQRRLWFLDQLYPGQSTYHIPGAIAVSGPLNLARLEQALFQVIERHESLRSRFPNSEGEPYVVIDPAQRLPLRTQTLADSATTDQVQQHLRQLVQQPFDLANGPLLRVEVWQQNATSFYVLFCLHHIIADYLSLRLLVQELGLIYNGADSAALLPALPVQYVDYAHWQHQQRAKFEQQLQFWQRQLAQLPPTLTLPTDKPRPAQQSTKGRRVEFQLSSALSQGLQQLAQQQQVSLFVVLLSGWQALLQRYSGQDDIVVGSTVSNREHKDTQHLIGLFVNNLVFRTQLDGQWSFEQLLQATKQTTLDALSHQHIPFEQLVDQLPVERALDRHPIFQVAFVLHNTPEPEVRLKEIQLRGLASDSLTTRFDVALDMVQHQDRLQGTLEYCSDLFNSDTIERLIGQYQKFLTAMVAEPKHSLAEVDWFLLDKTAATFAVGPNSITPELNSIFESSAQTHWTNRALQFRQFNLSYGELWQASNQLLTQFNQRNLSVEHPIALALPRSPELIVAMISCLRAGIAYIPLDIQQPPQRLAAMLEDAAAQQLLVMDVAQPAFGEFAVNQETIDALAPECPRLAVSWNRLSASGPAQANSRDDNSLYAKTPPPDSLAYIIFTSGSTGRPKGVPIRRSALSNFLTDMTTRLGVSEHSRLLAVTTVGFDISGLEILLPLANGGTLVLADDEQRQNGADLATLLQQQAITHMQSTPAGWRLLLASGWRPNDQQPLIKLCGGEALDTELAQALTQGPGDLWNLYGPTETTIWSAAATVASRSIASVRDSHLPIGEPLTNTWLQVIDPLGRAVPLGIPGELLIGGQGVSPGYLHLEALSNEKFVAVKGPEGRIETAYRTGDRVRRLKDGTLQFLGRIDHQVKLRGYRIEPGEIEAIINGFEGVAQSLVGLWGSDLLVAWLTVEGDFDKQALMAHLKDQLPSYMVPSCLVVLERFALNSNGKIDRNQLPEPQFDGVAAEPSALPLQTDTEHKLAELWQGLLPATISAANQDFFAAGGHSLLAARLLARINQGFGIALSLQALFQYPQLRSQASAIDQALANNNADTTLLPSHLPSQQTELVAGTEPCLSSAQQRQWLLAQLEPDSPFYNIPAAVEIAGLLDVERLQWSLTQLCQRHDNLRSLFPAKEGAATILIQPSLQPPIEVVDLCHLPADKNASQTKALLTQAARRPFDLANGPLLRVTLVKNSTQSSSLLLVIHHILADGWSVQLMLQELIALYQRNPSPLPPLPLQYADYAAWQRQIDSQPAMDYWCQQLAAAPALLDLPTDYSRPLAQQFVGDSVYFTIAEQQLDQLKQLAQQQQATLFMVLMALYQWMLHRYSEMDDILVGTPVGHRPDPRLERLIGLFTNTLVIRTKINGHETLNELLGRVRATVIAAFDHQQAPFDQVLEALAVPRNWSHAPLIQTMLFWQPANPDSGQQSQHWRPLPLNYQQAKFDLSLHLAEENGCIQGRLDFRRDLFMPATIEQMAQGFQGLIEACCQQPQRPLKSLGLLSQTQRQQLQRWNSTEFADQFWQQQRLTALSQAGGNQQAANHKVQTLGQALWQPFAHQARLQPEKTALKVGTQDWSYQQLDQWSQQIAAQLLQQGAGPERPVAVCLPRQATLIAALLGTLKAGAPYVPLDPNYPSQRLIQILQNAQCKLMLCHPEQLSAELSAAAQQAGVKLLAMNPGLPENPQPALPAVTSTNTAYIIYTSGSTGVPKGVTIGHGQALALVHWASTVYDAAQLQGVLASTSVCFDLSIFEIFVPLSLGGRLILVDSVLELPELATCQEVSLINTVPTAATELLRLGPLPDSVTTVNLAGEALPASLVRNLYLQPKVQAVFNLYGPSEDTTYSTGIKLDPAQPDNQVVPIGYPIQGTQVQVLDANLLPVPPGVCGELYLSGAGVAKGYWRQPELSQQRFVEIPTLMHGDDNSNHSVNHKAHPNANSVLAYRTGDRVRQRADGALEYLGRLDSQVKIRGFRIETGEIEAALEQHPQLQRAVVIAKSLGSEPSHRRLIAYVILQQSSQQNTLDQAPEDGRLVSELRDHLQRLIPHYMVPHRFVLLPQIPLLPNGKVDRNALPTPSDEPEQDPTLASTQVSDLTQDLDPNSQTLALIWQQLLNRSAIQPDANFFELGGDSIIAIQMVAKAREQGLYLLPKDVFLHPSLRALAAQARPLAEASTISQQPLTGEVPLLPAQHWFFSQPLKHPDHWNQSLLLTVKQPLSLDILKLACLGLAQQHDSMRARFYRHQNQWHQQISPELPSEVPFIYAVKADTDNLKATIERHANCAQGKFNLQQAPLWRLVYFDLTHQGKQERRLLLVFHHLIIDGVSWRILLGDLWQTYQQLAAQTVKDPNSVALSPRTHNQQDWVLGLQHNLTAFTQQRHYWRQQCQPQPQLPVDRTDNNLSAKTPSVKSLSVGLDQALTERWLRELPTHYNIRSDELLLAALAWSLTHWSQRQQVQIWLESHGRDGLTASNLDLTHTMGWFTSLYPLTLSLPTTDSLDEIAKAIKSQYRSVPQQGLGYAVLRWMASTTESELSCQPEVRFNYLGQSDGLFTDHPMFTAASEGTGHARHPADQQDVKLDINALVSAGQLRIYWHYNASLYQATSIQQLAADCVSKLQQLLAHCVGDQHDGGLVPEDFPDMNLDADELDSLLDNI